jgi:hypothetical protein
MRKTIVAVVLAISVLGIGAVALAAETRHVDAKLTPGADVPKPKGAAGAHGSFTGTFVENKSKKSAVLRWTLSFTKLTGPALQAHIHLGKVGVSGNVIVPLCAPCKNGQTGKMQIPESVVDAMEKGRTYVNVHTKKNLAGEIRGQVKVTG